MKQIHGKINFYDFRKTLGLEIVFGKHVRHNFSRHTHRTLCIGLVEQGTRIILCRGERYKIIPGQIFIIPPDEAHSCGSEERPHTYRLFLISPDVLNMILLKTEGNRYRFNNLVIDDSERFDELMYLDSILMSGETIFVKQSVLVSTIGNIIESCADIGEDLKMCNMQFDSVKSIQTFIDHHYAEHFSLWDISRHAYLSPYYLIRVFSQIVGIPPHIYQQQVRIRYAKEMLANRISIAEVALRNGFTDQSYFSNIFKKMVGITPGEYIKSIQIE